MNSYNNSSSSFVRNRISGTSTMALTSYVVAWLGIVVWLGIAVGCGDVETISSGSGSNVAAEPGATPIDSVATPIDSVALADRSRNAEKSAESTALLFELIAPDKTGIHFVNVLDPDDPQHYLYHSGSSCGGVTIGDVDGDGRADIYLLAGPGKNRLFRQVDDFVFEDVTEAAGVDGGGAWSAGAAMVDIDGDGDLDIYVCNYDSPNLLYINDGRGRFTEKAKSWGVDVVDASLMPAFCDYDLDGDMDFYLLINRLIDPDGIPLKAPIEIVDGRPQILPDKNRYWEIDQIGSSVGYRAVSRPDRFFRNNGNGTFSDVTIEARISGVGDGLSATWWDYDRDGWPDLYVGNDFEGPDHLYHNNGDGTFTDAIEEVVTHTSWFSMGADIADINNDGLIDLLSADMSATTHFMEKTSMGAMSADRIAAVAGPPPQYMRNTLYLNSGTTPFMEVAYLAGLGSSDWTWSVKFGDLDNDGRVDLFITNGTSRNSTDSDISIEDTPLVAGTHMWDYFRDKPPRREQNLAFRNRGDLVFQDVSHDWGLGHVGMSYAAAYADLDRDGDLDIVVVNLDEPVSIYRNNSAENHRLLIRLRGTRSNRHGVGATVKIENAAGLQVRYLTLARGFMSANEPLVHFGLGENEVIDRLTVEWPSGHVQTFENLQADRFYTITEPEGEPAEISPSEKDAPTTMFARSERFTWPDNEHQEREFDDFARQPLLPNKLSQLGPGMAWGDVDGDGRDDLYVGAAAGQAAALHLSTPEGTFRSSTPAVFNADRACEDMAPLFFDADGDGDLDLYVVSGGVECEPGDEVLRDRLYLNDGSGNFTKATDALPDLRDSGGVAVAADFDRDGDLDLFVGGRVIPGEYPLAPQSRILQNNGGRFTDVTESVAPSLATTGLVTGAIWSDADGDGWLDLLVTHEWGPVKMFRNDRGRLIDQTATAGLAERLGWWNSIAGRDVDGDGDVDYVVTNFGLNTKYHATAEHPVRLFYGDLDGSGVRRLIEADYEGDTLYPVRGKSCSTNAMPSLGAKFTTYKAFALAPLDEIYTDERLKNADEFQINTLESGVLLNDGTGRFTFTALPRLAQASPGFGLVLTDVDGDGHTDLYVVQNFFTPQAETGRMDGGLSLLLKGNGDGTFTPVWPHESGLIVPGDAKGLTAADLNGDGWVDFVIGINDGELITYENRGQADQRVLTVRLAGRPGNPTAIGARVTLERSDGHRQTAEVHAGSGYLSQSSATLTFGLGATHTASTLTIRWPDGTTTSTTPDAKESHLHIAQPAEASN